MNKPSLLFIFSVLLLLGSYGAFSQLSDKQSDYLRATKEFVNAYRSSEYPKQRILLIKEVNMQRFEECFESLFQDTLLITREEQEYIKNEISKPRFFEWSDTFLDSSNFIKRDTIVSIVKDPTRSWRYFYSHYSKEFHSFSAPIFLRDNKMCLFYSDFHCGWLCGEGIVMLYKKEDGIWKLYRKFCEWIS